MSDDRHVLNLPTPAESNAQIEGFVARSPTGLSAIGAGLTESQQGFFLFMTHERMSWQQQNLGHAPPDKADGGTGLSSSGGRSSLQVGNG